MSLYIDGTDMHGDYYGGIASGPYAVYDDEKQDWLVTGLRWYWLARLYRWREEKRRAKKSRRKN